MKEMLIKMMLDTVKYLPSGKSYLEGDTKLWLLHQVYTMQSVSEDDITMDTVDLWLNYCNAIARYRVEQLKLDIQAYHNDCRAFAMQMGIEA